MRYPESPEAHLFFLMYGKRRCLDSKKLIEEQDSKSLAPPGPSPVHRRILCVCVHEIDGARRPDTQIRHRVFKSMGRFTILSPVWSGS